MTVANLRMQQNFSRAAARYDAHAWLQHEQTARLFAQLSPLLEGNAKVLDLGCGTGEFGRLAQEGKRAWRITGIDYSHAMALKAAPRCTHIVQADATQLPIADASADAVISSFCMQWVNDKAAMLAEIERVLKPGGVAGIITLGSRTLQELREAADLSGVPLGLLAMLRADQYRALAMKCGLKMTALQATSEQRYYSSVEALLASMRAIGAGNAQEDRQRQLVPPKRFAQMIQQYEALYGNRRGVPATWEMVLMMFRKAA